MVRIRACGTILLHSAPSFATLFRHVLIVLGGDASLGRRDAVEQLSKRVPFDSSSIQQVLDVRERKVDPKKLDVQDLCAGYLAAIEKVVAAVDEAPSV